MREDWPFSSPRAVAKHMLKALVAAHDDPAGEEHDSHRQGIEHQLFLGDQLAVGILRALQFGDPAQRVFDGRAQLRLAARQARDQLLVFDPRAQGAQMAAVDFPVDAHHHRTEHRHHQRKQRVGPAALQRELQHHGKERRHADNRRTPPEWPRTRPPRR